MQPYSIHLFASKGTPDGILHLEKCNWSGFGVVFQKAHHQALENEKGFHQAGIYILVSNTAEEIIYIGQGDPVGNRLTHHINKKEGWEWGVYFVDINTKIGKTEIQFLESALIALARKRGRAILLNKDNPTEPSMSPATKAFAQAFLADMLLILPLIGINAFRPRKQHETLEQPPVIETNNDAFDTIVIPAREAGFNKVFLSEHCWYAVRINRRHLKKLKYIAAYQVAPIAAITHTAEIQSITRYGNTNKYQINFKAPAKQIVPIQRPENSEINMQSSRYALYEKLILAKNLDDVWHKS